MTTMHAGRVAGLKLHTEKCSCGGTMFMAPCKCPFRRKGYATCAKCMNPACGKMVGVQLRSRHLRARVPSPFGVVR